ncbi:hypothetical protein NVS55_12630 [Myxococcus stipitatus]|uniref:hypothetical protein n=1 Tax=Myxococcus stipitatus TaxID=83455 RepID=UPI0031452679
MQTLSRPTAQVLVLLSLFVSSPAFAEDRPEQEGGFPTWLALSARGGYFIPGGGMENTPPEPVYLYEVYKGLFSVILEPTLRIGSHVEVGPWAQFSYAQMRVQCAEDKACKGGNFRFGLQANYHWIPSGPVDVWSGLSLGYDKSSIHVPDADITYSGPDFTLQAGGDKNFGGNFWAGLFLGVTGGWYDTLDVKLPTGSGSEKLRERAFHLWIGFGVRVRLAAPLST